jgi:hypothetical protein
MRSYHQRVLPKGTSSRPPGLSKPLPRFRSYRISPIQANIDLFKIWSNQALQRSLQNGLKARASDGSCICHLASIEEIA